MTVVVVSLVDTGPPRTSPMGSEPEWPGECHGNGGVSSDVVGPPEWECEAMGSVGDIAISYDPPRRGRVKTQWRVTKEAQ